MYRVLLRNEPVVPLSKIVKLQNQAARVATTSPFDYSSLPLISQLG